MFISKDGTTRLWLYRAFAWIWRFRTLVVCESAFANDIAPTILRRRFFGYWLHLDVSRSNAQQLLFLEGTRYIGERKLLWSLARPGSVVVDIGANIGYYTLLIEARVSRSGKIIAFEPEPDNLIELRLNVEQNLLKNVEIRPFAVGATPGVVAFARGINGGVSEDGALLADTAIKVPMVALDDVLDGPVDLIKIDVEGYEGEVLAGARKVIERWRPNLFVEIHPRMIAGVHTVDSLFGFLSNYYSNIELYQSAQMQTIPRKILSRYFSIGNVQTLSSLEAVALRCRQGLQDTFWAVCRSQNKSRI